MIIPTLCLCFMIQESELAHPYLAAATRKPRRLASERNYQNRTARNPTEDRLTACKWLISLNCQMLATEVSFLRKW